MRAIQVWRWCAPAPGARPVATSSLLRIPDDRIDAALSMLLAAWRATGGNGLPMPDIVDAPEPPPPIPPTGSRGLERFTVEQLVEMGTCQDCDSRIFFEKLPTAAVGPFVYRCITNHDPTCPAYRQMQAHYQQHSGE